MNGFLTVRRDDYQAARQSESEDAIRIPKEQKQKQISPMNKIIIGIFIYSFTHKFSQPSNRDSQGAKVQNQQDLNRKKPMNQHHNNSSDNFHTMVDDDDSSINDIFKDLSQNTETDLDEVQESNENEHSEGKVKVSEGESKSNQNESNRIKNLNQKGENKKQLKAFISQNEVNENTLQWGHYKSHLIYNLSQRKNNPLSMSMSYIPNMDQEWIYTNYSQKSKEAAVFYDFLYNDGVRFSEFKIQDQRYDFKVKSSFFKQSASQKNQKWINQHKIYKTNDNLAGQKRSLIFSLSKEIYDELNMGGETKYFHFSFKIVDNAIHVDVYNLVDNQLSQLNNDSTKFIGSFTFRISQDNVDLKGESLKQIIRYSQVSQSNLDQVWNIQSSLNHNFSSNKQNELNNYEQNNKLVNMLLIQFIFDSRQDYIITISFSSIRPANKQTLYLKSTISNIMTKLKEQYEIQLKQSIESKGISDNHSCTVSALSNLLGGMTYKYGELKYTQYAEQKKSVPKSIFSFTPSRTRFGWSFLWDDGFHNAVASKFQPKLSAFVIKSWLDSMNEEGWICREQTRGEEAFGLCNCPNFIEKDNRDGNPPSLILTLEYFLRDHLEIVQDLIDTGYLEKIEKWYHWYLKSQMVKDDFYKGNEYDFADIVSNSFVFKFWDVNGRQHSMNSGMDDFPRNDNSNQYSTPIGHIDAQSWMYHFTTIMEKLSLFNQDIKKADYYKLLKETIQDRTQEYFFDDDDLLYKDILSSKGSLSSITYSPHFGYPNLLPLAFGIVKDDGFQLPRIIQRIQNPEILWTQYGLRSLQKNDSYFKKGNNYWTGPIWVQINYIVLRGLKLYYSSNQQAINLYKELRENVSKLVCSNWERSGFFYENYNKYENGYGSDAYPFTGWTATVALINSENY